VTFPELQQALDGLRGLSFPPQSLQTHWLGLQDVDLAALRRAVQHAAKTCARFPAPAELRALIEAQPRDLPEVPVLTTPLETPRVVGTLPTGRPIVQTAEYDAWCPECDDSGWAPAELGGAPAVRRCRCWSDNPLLLRARDVQARLAAQRTAGVKAP